MAILLLWTRRAIVPHDEPTAVPRESAKLPNAVGSWLCRAPRAPRPAYLRSIATAQSLPAGAWIPPAPILQYYMFDVKLVSLRSASQFHCRLEELEPRGSVHCRQMWPISERLFSLAGWLPRSRRNSALSPFLS